ncbi:MAG: septum formation inhibitor Maf [Flavobacteriaceae bacterium]|nr:septum formation inhibitor Maf [Flavobacteriaceae bacterium]
MKAIGVLVVLGLCVLAYFGFANTSKSNLNNETVKVTKSESRTLSQGFQDYWYAGQAEITSYKLTQERYGELRDGTSVTIFVTEDFLPKEQVKANRSAEKNIPVLKLNHTKKYLTGIYPYSVMTSTFSPVNNKDHALKSTFSMQEWCGQVYLQLNNRKDYEILSHSYFEGEADQNMSLPKTWLENEFWNLIRINPEELPTGEFTALPSFEYFRMSHTPLKEADATASLFKGDSLSTYTLTYPDLNRELKIYFESKPPYEIERWEELHPNGMKTSAEKIERIKSAYWNQNSNQYLYLRDSLGL